MPLLPCERRAASAAAGAAAALALTATFACARAAHAEPVHFNRQVRPLLSQNCFFCHGPDRNKRKGGLRLDDRDAAIAKGAIVPGDARGSELWKRLVSHDEDEKMPPPESHKRLSAEEIALLARWIDEGAVYQPHWAYVPVARPPVPTPRDLSGVRNPIDRFVRARLDAEGLSPSPPADPRTLLRRLSLDLLGLPPSPEELDAFERDGRPDAWARAIARLIASPHYGERMAVPWLDAVRYADTVGFHGDQSVHVFPYREWVVNAFNRNLPFDQFVIQQLAGDLLPRPTPATLTATAFNRLNMVTREGGAQEKEYLAKYMADRVRTLGTALLGATVGCAECHDHKYDPFTTRDFYALGAFFADLKEFGIYHNYHYTPVPELRGWSNDHPFPPEIEVRSPYLEARVAALRTRHRAHARQVLAAARAPEQAAALDDWRTALRAFLARHPDGFAVQQPADLRAIDEVAIARPDGFVELQRADGRKPGEKGTDSNLRVELRPGTMTVAALRLEVTPKTWPDYEKDPLADGTATVLPELWLVRADSPDAASSLSEDRGEALALHHGEATHRAAVWVEGSPVPGTRKGWKLPIDRERAMTAIWELTVPVTLRAGDLLRVRLPARFLARVRVSLSPLAAWGAATLPPHLPPPAGTPEARARGGAAGALAAFARARLAAARGAPDLSLAELFLHGTGFSTELLREQRRLFRDALEARDGKAWVVVSQAVPQPRPIRILPRGNWQDESGPLVTPATPEFLPRAGLTATGPGGRATRLDLARWLTARDNPLTARVFVNRLWRHFFGTGLSATLDDLGAQGEPPSHPELLDWLAAEFMDSGWDVKRLVTLIVDSATYRQSSRGRPELAARDPDNRLLARQSPRRLDAEFVRDNALAIAGLLERGVGGPSARPYQPDGYYDNLQFPLRQYVAHEDERQYRRGLYVHWQRTFLHPMLVNFDAPPRDECAADRPRSNTPQQALTLLNDPTFVEAARALAARLLGDASLRDDDARLQRGFLLATGRRARDDELALLRAQLLAERRDFAARPDDARALLSVGLFRAAAPPPAPEWAAWTAVCRTILNLYETITRI